MRFFLTFLVLLVLVLPARAQNAAEPLIITDRPDFTESGVIVPLGRVQVEAGTTWWRAGETNVLVAPEALVRWAPAWSPGGRLEVRLGVPDYVGTDGIAGRSDGSVGAKLQLGPVQGTDLALIATVAVPTSSDDVDGPEAELLLAAGRDLEGGASIGVQVGGAYFGEGVDEGVLSGTVVVGTGLTERLGGFLELAAEVPTEGANALLVHHGYTFLLRPRLQLDLHGGFGLTDAAPDVFLGGGVSVRL